MIDFPAQIAARIRSREQIAADRARAAFHGRRVVFTNGCFDILHEGHVRYLAEARSQGDLLVVGLNSDASVSRLKGPERPFNTQASRALVMASLLMVDAVVIFDEDTPESLIHLLRPDVLVKGGDWAVDQIIGGAFVQGYGGQVISLPFHPGFSTTGIAERIRRG